MTFQAHNGSILFEGRSIPGMRAVLVRQHLVSISLDRSTDQSRAEKAWALANQLRAAITDADKQRKVAA